MPKIESKILDNYLRPPSLRNIKTTFIPKEHIPERRGVIDGEAVDVPQEKTGGAIMVIYTNSRKDLMVVESKKQED
jgi:hypothetical protein